MAGLPERARPQAIKQLIVKLVPHRSEGETIDQSLGASCSLCPHRIAAPPSSVMKSRRFTDRELPCFRQEEYHVLVRQEVAALRDFNSAHDRSGSKAALGPGPLQCPDCPKTDIGTFP